LRRNLGFYDKVSRSLRFRNSNVWVR